MNYKITAIKDVRCLFNVPHQKRLDLGGGQFAIVPGERQEWISLKAGESKSGLHMLIGIDPASARNCPADWIKLGNVVSPPWGNGELPKNFSGIFILDFLPD